jgi:hypothetical protein
MLICNCVDFCVVCYEMFCRGRTDSLPLDKLWYNIVELVYSLQSKEGEFMQLTGVCGSVSERVYKDKKGVEVRQHQFTIIDDTVGNCDCVLQSGSSLPPRGGDLIVTVERVRAPFLNRIFYFVKEWRLANGAGSSVPQSPTVPPSVRLPK